MSKQKASRCPHVVLVGKTSWEDVRLKEEANTCDQCNVHGPNLWLCLHSGCLTTGCGESAEDHSTKHHEANRHCLTMNLTTKRIWCYTCEREVFKNNNSPPLVMREKSLVVNTGAPTPDNSLQRDLSCEMEELSESEEDENTKVRGLIGLKNIGNTCYMNAALQALSNCPPLCQFFLDCGGFVPLDKKPGLSKNFMKLLNDMWHRNGTSYLIPSVVAHGMKSVHPMFRGYTQQDTQEFLRCFMDQLHEELKRPVIEVDESDVLSHITKRQPSVDSSASSGGPTDGDYETCDSGMSSERHSVEEEETCSVLMGEESERPECDIPMVEDSVGGGVSAVGSSDIVEMDSEQSADVSGSYETNNVSTDHMEIDSNSQASSVDIETKEIWDKGHRSNAINDKSVDKSQKMDTHSVSGDTGQDGGQEARTKLSSNPSQSLLRSTPAKSRKTKSEQSSPPKQLYSDRMVAAKSQDVKSQDMSERIRKPVHYSSVISDVFDGKILSSVQCLTCERFSSTKETFQDLSLPIPSKDHLFMLNAQQGSRSVKGTCGEVNPGWMAWVWTYMRSWFWGPTIQLDNCLAAFFSEDELKGDNMYSCEKCKKLRNGMKFSKVLELPEILCIHLKRFRHEFMFSSKIGSYVSFPLHGLDMRPYLHKDFKGQVTVYDLVAVICHHGTAGGGHYTAYALNFINEKWYEFDDRIVSMVPVSHVENCEAYVLFYRKRNEDVVRHRKIATQLMESTEPSLMQFYISRQWMNKFYTFAEPGPISNQDFLCKHGGVPPSMLSYVGQLVQSCPQPIWEYLHECYGGGPAVNHLGPCNICQNEIDALQKRRSEEKKRFQDANKEFLDDDNPTVIFAIAMKWFKEWENFVVGKDDTPPGPIDNKRIALQRPGGLFVAKPGSDYGQVSEKAWLFFKEVYSGGPEVVFKQRASNVQKQEQSRDAASSDRAEV